MKSKEREQKKAAFRQGRLLDRYGTFVIIMLCLLLAVIAGLIVLTQKRLHKAEDQQTVYSRHYMFVSRAGNSYVSDRIYEEAKEYGKKKGVYVEQLDHFLDAGYDEADYLKMAVSMQVDGIILEGTAEDEVRHWVNQASEQGIPVVAILSDCPGSRRKSFIELGDYALGKEYGRVVVNIARTREPKVVLLMEQTEGENQIQTGIRETLKTEGSHLQVQFQTEYVGGETGIRLPDKIRELLEEEENRPDILLCRNERDTQLVYQSVIDYDLEGEVQIIGSCVSEALMRAVQDGEVAALIDVDTGQVGMFCIDALDHYIENGSVNDYIVVDDMVITAENVERYLDEE